MKKRVSVHISGTIDEREVDEFFLDMRRYTPEGGNTTFSIYDERTEATEAF